MPVTERLTIEQRVSKYMQQQIPPAQEVDFDDVARHVVDMVRRAPLDPPTASNFNGDWTSPDAPDYLPKRSAIYDRDGTQCYSSVGQLWEARGGQWVRIK